MNLDLQGKNALVCGSSRGIGKAIAIELAALGANVTLVARSADKLAQNIHKLQKIDGQQHDYLVADFSDPEDLKKRVKGLLAKKKIHILINNTGGPAGGEILKAEPEQFLDAYRKHLICNHLLVQLVVPGMKSEGYGRIINIISTSVKAPIPGLGVSNTTRGAVASWAKTMANELAPHGITVNNILPGFTQTERIDEIVSARAQKAGISEDEAKARMVATVPMARFADPSEIANVAAFLASPAASYVSGTSLRVDGSRTASI